MLASYGERKIHEILEGNGVNFTEELSFEGLVSSNGKLLRFDFAVYDDDGNIEALIEYQGIQHYQPSSKYGGKKGFYQQQYNDNKKRTFCKLHNIKLIEVPYTDYNIITYDYLMEKILY